MTPSRAFLAAMALGLVFIVQPWVHALFVAGFPLVFFGILAYNAASWFGAEDGSAARGPARGRDGKEGP